MILGLFFASILAFRRIGIGAFLCPEDRGKKVKKIGRPLTKEVMIEHLAMEVEASAEHAEECADEAKRLEKLERIRRAAITIISLNNGLRSPKDSLGPRLISIMGDEDGCDEAA